MSDLNPYMWIAEPLLGLEGAMPRHFFGCDSVYVRGRLLLVLSDGEEPWNGAMFPVEKCHHAEVLARWPDLAEHPVLPKWLYLSASQECFETLAAELVRELVRGNPLLGVDPPSKKRSRGKGSSADNRKVAESSIPPHLR